MTEKRKELTTMQKAFLDALFGEAKGNYKQAMNIAGYNHTNITEVMRAIGPEIRQMAEDVILANTPRAIHEYVSTFDDANAPGIVNKIRVAEGILDRAGIAKKDPSDVKINTGGGLVLLPVKAVDPDMLERFNRQQEKASEE